MHLITAVSRFCFATFLWIACSSFGAEASSPPTADRIDKYLTNNVQNGVSGSILVVQDGIVLLNKGYGFANRDTRLANSPSTVFDIGSLTKQFTAAAVLKLVELEKLQLSDTIDTFFSDLPHDKKQITVHHLLTHTAGFKEFPGRDFDVVSKESYFQTVFESKLEFEPGARYKYSNVGYSILSAIIEQAAQTDYETFLRRVFFDPLSMLQTGYLYPGWESSDFAHGYYEDFYDRGTSVERFAKDGVSPILVGNGGMQSTVSDLQKWLIALDSFDILSKESMRLLTGEHVQTPTQIDAFQSSTFYGYGWKVGKNKYSDFVISHNGNNGIFRSSIVWRPQERAFIIFLSNTETRGTLWLAYELDRMLAEPDYQPKSIEPNPYRVIDEYVHNSQAVSANGLLSEYRLRTGHQTINSTVINQLARIYFRLNIDTEWALELLELNVRLHPDDGNLWDSLGEGYLQMGQYEPALAAFEMSLNLAPEKDCYWCENAQSKIRSLTTD